MKTGDGAKEKSPSLSESDTEEKCIASCVCNSEQNKIKAKQSISLALKSEVKTKSITHSTLPKYNPTPISQLQKRVESENSVFGNSIAKSEPYSPNGLGPLPSVSYNPSDISNLDKNIASTASYNPTSFSTISNVKEEYKPSGLTEIQLKNYKPSEINSIKHKEPTYTPEGSVNNNNLNYEPSNKLSIIKQEPEYSPSGGSKNFKIKLEYTPSSNANYSKKDLEYSPLVVAPKDAEKDGKNGLIDNGSQESLSYIPTKKSKLSHTPHIVDVDIFAKEKSKSSNPSSSHKSSEKSSKSSKHKRSHSSSSSSRDSKKQKHDTSGSVKKSSSSKVTSTDDKDKKKSSHSRSSSSSKHSSVSHRSSSSSQKDKKHKHSSSSKESDRDKSKSRHHTSKKSSHRDKGKEDSKKSKKDKHHSSRKNDSAKHSSTTNGTKACEQSSVNRDLLQDESEDDSDLDQEENPDEVLQECARIFEEFEFEEINCNSKQSTNTRTTDSTKQNNIQVSEVHEEMTVQAAAAKKRVAHESATRSLPPPTMNRIRPVSASAGQMLAERWRKQQLLQKAKEADEPATSSSGVSDLLSQLMDDAPPKATMSWLKKKTPGNNNETLTAEERTTAQSNGKGKRRVAHTAREEILQRPIVQAAAGDKIPASRRQFVLDKFADNCLQIYPNSHDAFQKAIQLEKICSDRSNTVAVYNNLFVNQILRLKHAKTPAAVLAMDSQTPMPEVKHVISYSGGTMERTTVTRILDFHGPELYNRLIKYKLLKQDLVEHGYPYEHESKEKGKAQLEKVIYPGQNVKQRTNLKPRQKECMRCHETYFVDKRGMPEKAKCYYHPKRLNSVKSKDNSRELRYDCCGYLDRSEGCETNPYHVSENLDYKNMSGFVKTFSKEKRDGFHGIYAMDCEMVMTTLGMEVARVSVVDEHQTAVYDALIKPDNPILDYCYMFSGITKEMLAGVKTTLRDVQCVLLNKFSADTILIGHSLNSDLQVLKMMHETVIDTSIVFPHKLGLPHRRKLKTIYKEILNGNIQNGAEGHDSFEDARACMHLMLHRAREDAKLE